MRDGRAGAAAEEARQFQRATGEGQKPPEGLSAEGRIGTRIVGIYLRLLQGIPLAQLRQVLAELFGLAISEGALVNILDASQGLFGGDVPDQRAAAGRHNPGVGRDRSQGRQANWWLSITPTAPSSSPTSTVPRQWCKPSLAIIARVDDLRPLWWWPDGLNQARGSGLSRASGPRHAIRLRGWRRRLRAGPEGRPAKRACAIGRRRDRLTDATLKSYEADLDRRLDGVMALVPSHPAGGKLQTVIRKTGRELSVFVRTVISPQSTTARSGRCALVRSTARSSTASAVNGVRIYADKGRLS